MDIITEAHQNGVWEESVPDVNSFQSPVQNNNEPVFETTESNDVRVSNENLEVLTSESVENDRIITNSASVYTHEIDESQYVVIRPEDSPQDCVPCDENDSNNDSDIEVRMYSLIIF